MRPPSSSPPSIAAVPETPIVTVRGLRHDVDGRVVLDLPGWELERGAHALLAGPSGSGKTTLLHLVAGLIRPTAGEVTVAGEVVTALPGAAVDQLRGQRIGIVFQGLHLIRALTAEQNLALARRLAGMPPDPGRVRALLAEVGLAGRERARPEQLSHGEAQRVAIARALVNGPALLLADEPTSALDDANAERVLELLLAQARAHRTTLLVASHDGRLRGRLPARLELEARP